MPELPEVETVRRGLQELIVGKKITNISFDWPKGFPNAPEQVDAFAINARVLGVRRRAKVLLIDLSSNYSFVVHLKMTGQLVFRGEQNFGAGHPNDSLVGELPDTSTRVIITFSDATTLYFNDQRKFGWMRLLPTIEIPNIDFMKKLGPEPLEAGFTEQVFYSQLQKRKKSNIKATLLDQSVIAGIGNIYADESLFIAGIHPKSLTGEIPKKRLQDLYGAIIAVLKLSIEKGGSTDKNYVNAKGKKGSYISFAKVFRKEGTACPNNCGSIITKIRVAGRGTHVCSTCQIIYGGSQ